MRSFFTSGLSSYCHHFVISSFKLRVKFRNISVFSLHSQINLTVRP
nr:MAG TPA: hypothetical protein [Caudoviricetes sp.]